MENKTEFENETKPELIAKADAEYRPGVEGEDCMACQHFQEPDRCGKVRGEISPTGTCDLWELPDEMGMGQEASSIEDILFGGGGV
ncbi:hypothetical protein [Idiomarina abyssalis]|uniref:hypothetical protein n=1 Tax=Idiomarina abyssalis TaxID=86102 RepID=UPI003A8E9298